MKIIFSRKGFDAGTGGIASPIFEDNRICSIPIPGSKGGGRRYREIKFDGCNLGDIIKDLTRKRGRLFTGNDYAHLDPDLRNGAVGDRPPGWLPAFGPGGGAQTQLRDHGVGAGDIFLFFGWFRRASNKDGPYRFIRGAPNQHVIFGWLQVGKVYHLLSDDSELPGWADRHPHISRGEDWRDLVTASKGAALYVATKRLKMPGLKKWLPGGGTFRKYHSRLSLTAELGGPRSVWRLPAWMYPSKGRRPLACHEPSKNEIKRWGKDNKGTLLETVPRGQEFVLHGEDYPEAEKWLASLFNAVA